MPFWNDTRAESYKAKLEHKLMLAKETPESSFDLADCNLTEVPSGVFSMCRVFLKESLLLEDNKLASLKNGGSLKDLSGILKLNLQNNRFSMLPDEIHSLSSLQELNLENNQLKKLPLTFAKLTSLRKLNLKGNRLLYFPQQICALHSLESLNICDNSKIKMFPKDLCNLVQLKCLELDSSSMTYPSSDICSGGTESIMKFLCSEYGKDYIPPEESSAISNNEADNLGPDDGSRDLSASYKQYQKAKMQKQQELLLMEEALKQNYELQSYSAADANLKRQKLLEDITQDQERMENEIILLQNRKEKEKHTLLEILSKVEDHSAKLIEHLMVLNDRNVNLNKMLEVLEKDRLEEEMFSIKQEELEKLRKKEILEAMTEQLQSEEKQRIYEKDKNVIQAQLQNEENESNLKLYNLFQNRELDQQILINTILEEEQFQKQAFEALQRQKDLQHIEIAKQIQLIEKELTSLTAAEIKKKDLKITSDVNILAEHRTALAYLLTDLFNAKEKREEELKERLNQMEQQRVNEMEDFWLIQYQKLLDRKPIGVIHAESEIDPNVRYVLEEANALDYMPMFAVKQITLYDLASFTIGDLKKVGILDEDICQRILDLAFKLYKSKDVDKELQKPTDLEPPPSAPPEQDVQSSPEELLSPSAPPISPEKDIKLWCQTECVICLDMQSSAVFLPCGHVCCCQNCSSVDICPMCRSVIVSKFTLTIS